MKKNVVKDLFSFIESSPTTFHTVDTIKAILEKDGFRELSRADDWKNIGKGIAGKGAGKATGKTPGKGAAPGKYYTTRNNTSIIAFKIGKDVADSYGFMISASHSDSPTFKIKENAEISVRGQYTKLNTEGYGGMICSTWFDRPLSFAGRVVIKENDTFVTKLFDPDRDLLMIPNLAIHMNRDVNDGYKYNKQVDLLPLFAGGADGAAGADKVAGANEVSLKNFVSRELKVSPDSVMGMDLYLYNRMKPVVWGLNDEFISAPRLDDLECAFTSLEGFLEGENSKMVQVYACFDNEELGSGTKQGAASTFLFDVLSRINRNLGKSEDDYERALSSSFMLSCDNAHAVHPNHPEKTDDTNCAYLNSGIVIKSHAGQKYTSDAVSVALFRDICQRAGKAGKTEKAGKIGKAEKAGKTGKAGGPGVPCQFFANRSDAAGGSTLGNIAMTQVSINCVDIGLPQLAMHSAYETAGALDVGYMVDALTEFYNSYIEVHGDSEIKCGK